MIYLNIFIGYIFLSIIYWRVRNLYYNKIELEFRYDLYQLRDKLRRYAIDEKIKSNEWTFEYLDTSICKAIMKVTSLNFILISFLYFKNMKKEGFINFQKKVSESLEKNTFAKEIYDEYGELMARYFYKKHYLMRFFLNILGGIIHSFSYCNNKIKQAKDAVDNLRIYPETSTGPNFYN